MKTGIKVGSVMTRNFVSVIPETSLIDSIKKMAKEKIGSLLIEEKQNLRGIVTNTDVIKAISIGIRLDSSIHKIMTKKIVFVDPKKDIYDAILVMRKNKVRWLPVVSNKKVIGMLTLKDILKIEPELFDIVVQNVQIAEEEEKKKRIKFADEYKWIREGPCDECGAYDLLYDFQGSFLCADCRKALRK